MLALEGAAALITQVVLSRVPVGIGEPLIRIHERELWLAAGVAALLVAALALATRRAPPPTVRLWMLVATPVAVAAFLAGLSFLSTPERERERDPGRRAISLPPGFRAAIYLQGTIDNPTVMTFAPNGDLFVGDIAGDLWLARRRPDGTVAPPTRFASGYELLLGLAWKESELFTSSAGKIEALRDTNGDGVADARRLVTGNLPTMIYKPHSNNSLTIGPDDRLYFGVGGTSNTGIETEPFAAAVLSVGLDGGEPRVVARGFGNPFEAAFNSRGDLFVGDNSAILPDGDEPPDTFHYVVPGGQYGASLPAGAAGMAIRPAMLEFPPHAVPTGLVFYNGERYPSDYLDNAFLALWSRGEVARIRLDRDTVSGAYYARATTWAEGLLYPIDIVVGPDGDLYIADFGTSVIYQIRYDGAMR